MAPNHKSPQPISTPKNTKFQNYDQQDSSTTTPIIVPLYIPTKNKDPNKFLVYFLLIFVFFFLLLVIFASVIKVKHPSLVIDSIIIKSLNYDYSSSSNVSDNNPSFNITTHMKIYLENRNFGHFEFDHMMQNQNMSMMSFVYGNGTVVGSSQLKFGSTRVAAREEERVEVDMVMSSSKIVLAMDDDSKKLESDLDSGVLEFMGYAAIKGKVYLLKKFRFHSVALMNCDIAIDLKRQLVLKLVC